MYCQKSSAHFLISFPTDPHRNPQTCRCFNHYDAPDQVPLKYKMRPAAPSAGPMSCFREPAASAGRSVLKGYCCLRISHCALFEITALKWDAQTEDLLM